MFPSLGESFKKTFDAISGKGRLRADDVLSASREIKLALLSADVHVSVVKEFVDGVAQNALGEKVLESITPAQQFTKIVHDELVRLLGKSTVPFDFSCKPPMVLLMVGLQGSGKTTTAARFAGYCKSLGRRPYLVPADVQRPAAIEQLRLLASKVGVDCYETSPKDKAVKVAKEALKHASKNGYDTVIIDTAGRLHVDEEMMGEVRDIAEKVNPQRILYVADSMTGQDAVRSAKAFNEALEITGVVLTKLDGDARGGAALSIRAVTGKPILFVGTGEGVDDLEPFYPERMAGRILGMGDVVSLVEKVASSVKEDEAKDLQEQMMKGRISFEDFLKHMKMMKKLGPLEKVIGMMPGLQNLSANINADEMENALKKREAMILSMTREERLNPRILNGSRRRRIAKGSGCEVFELNRFIKEFDSFAVMMKNLGRFGMKGLFKHLTS